MDHLDTLPVGSVFDANQLQQADLGDGIALARAGDGERGNNRQGERDLHADQHAATRPGLQFHHAPDFFDVRLDHIHAYTAAADVGDFLGGGEPRQENEIDNLAIAQAGHLVGGNQPFLHCLAANPVLVKAGSVVGDLDVDLSAFVKRAQRQTTLRIFPGRFADLRTFDTVVDGIPHDMSEWVFDRLDQRFVEFGFFTLHLDPHPLAACQGEIAYRTRQLAPDIADRLHASLHHAFLQLAGDEVEPLAGC